MRRIVLAVAIHVGVATSVQAQAALLGPGAAYLSSGSSSVETSDLDSRLRAGGYPTAANTLEGVPTFVPSGVPNDVQRRN
jgi:hypothetical protein